MARKNFVLYDTKTGRVYRLATSSTEDRVAWITALHTLISSTTTSNSDTPETATATATAATPSVGEAKPMSITSNFDNTDTTATTATPPSTDMASSKVPVLDMNTNQSFKRLRTTDAGISSKLRSRAATIKPSLGEVLNSQLVAHQGMLLKQGAIHQAWKQRHMVLLPASCSNAINTAVPYLFYYRSASDMTAEPNGCVDLTGCIVARELDESFTKSSTTSTTSTSTNRSVPITPPSIGVSFQSIIANAATLVRIQRTAVDAAAAATGVAGGNDASGELVGVEQVANTAAYCGWLNKRGAAVQSWKRRLFLLWKCYLYYFKSERVCDDRSTPSNVPLLSQHACRAVGRHCHWCDQLASGAGRGRGCSATN
jgi:hypothetical protein